MNAAATRTHAFRLRCHRSRAGYSTNTGAAGLRGYPGRVNFSTVNCGDGA